MPLKRNKLYLYLIIACVVGYIWLFYCLKNGVSENESIGVCIIKHTTNVPCPSCGSSRSVISIIKGNFYDALMFNPLGYFIALIMLITPYWISIDLILKKRSLFNFYQNIEMKLKKAQFAVPLVMLIVSNWIWNIIKGL